MNLDSEHLGIPVRVYLCVATVLGRARRSRDGLVMELLSSSPLGTPGWAARWDHVMTALGLYAVSAYTC